MKKNKGFTLIELLVVIAIIGILSSVVLASLNSARTKGADAAVKSNLANVRPQAEILYDTNGGYGVDTTPAAYAAGDCVTGNADTLFADPTVASQVAAAKSAGGGLVSCVSVVTGGGAWAVAAHLKTSGQSWCVDSTGRAEQEAVADQTQAVLNASLNAAGSCD